MKVWPGPYKWWNIKRFDSAYSNILGVGKFSQNTTNLLSIIDVATCFDSQSHHQANYWTMFRVHQVKVHTFGIPWLSHDSCRQPQMYVKPEAVITVFELLIMSGVSLETCWAIKKHWNNKFYYTVASCWLFLYDFYYEARTHGHKKSTHQLAVSTRRCN
jgi:predicted DCC family thiol-disulfide oxidoreductase YuxK